MAPRSGQGRDGLAVAVYQAIHRSILRGDYRPNQRLVEIDLAEALNASRTPVREALQRLADERLVARTRQGWMVREFTLEEIGEIYACRAALESYAARLVALRRDDIDLAPLTAVIARQDGPAGSASSVSDRVGLNDEFHSFLTGACGNSRIMEFLGRNQAYYFNYELAALYTEDELRDSLDEHARIYRAVREKDADRAATLMREHVETAYRLVQAKFGQS